MITIAICSSRCRGASLTTYKVLSLVLVMMVVVLGASSGISATVGAIFCISGDKISCHGRLIIARMVVGTTAAVATITVGADITIAPIVCGLVVVVKLLLLLLLLVLVVTMALRGCSSRLMKVIAIVMGSGPTSLMVVILIWADKLHPENNHVLSVSLSVSPLV